MKIDSNRYSDMLTKLRRVLIAAQFRADPQVDPTPEQIHATCLARADAAARCDYKRYLSSEGRCDRGFCSSFPAMVGTSYRYYFSLCDGAGRFCGRVEQRLQDGFQR
jgi:hypothetical protein